MELNSPQRIESRSAAHGKCHLLALGWHLALAASGGAAGCLAFNLNLPTAAMSWSVAQGFLLAAAALAIALRFCARRSHVMSVLMGWYLGSMFALPFTWHAFFGTGWGWLAWVTLAALLALPGLLAPRQRPAMGFLVAIVLASVPPLGFVGLCNPLLSSGALLPHGRWIALFLTLCFFGLSAFRGRAAPVAQMMLLAIGLVYLRLPAPEAPDYAWAAPTFDGAYPTNSLTASFKRQNEYKAMVKQALGAGAKLVLLPEGSNPSWDDGQAFYWKDVSDMARAKHAQVLLGVYTNPMNSTQADGLVDLSVGTIYPSMISMPIAMWRPWDSGSFPLHLSENMPIPTAAGPAAHLVCYEELLMWPLAAQEARTRPSLLLSAANQWFATGWTLRAQQRSAEMQARLWGLPLLRSVNYKTW